MLKSLRARQCRRNVLSLPLPGRKGKQEIVEETTWIDWDQQGRLVLARAGKLFASLDALGNPLNVHELADFNNNTPRPVIAPYKGKHW
jgi:hypothetical protein